VRFTDGALGVCLLADSVDTSLASLL